MALAHNPLCAKRMEVGHELGGEIVRPETVENDDERSTSRLAGCVASPIVAPACAE